MEGFLAADQKEQFVRDVMEVIDICRDHPRAALAVSTEGLSVTSSSRSVSSDIMEDTDHKMSDVSDGDTGKSTATVVPAAAAAAATTTATDVVRNCVSSDQSQVYCLGSVTSAQG